MFINSKSLSKEQCKDSGLAIVLICLICYQVWKLPVLILLAILFLLAAMTFPPIFKPFARFWFASSLALGTVVSKIILTTLFYLLVFPVGFFRRTIGKDAMQVNCWKKGTGSVMRVREHRFEAKDLEHPY